MSKIGEWLAWTLNRLFPPLNMHKELRWAKTSVKANQQWAYEEALRIYSYFGAYWNFTGKLVLDLGTGLGGKLRFYLESGARTVFGIDINEDSINISQQLMRSLGLSRSVLLLVADAAALPFCSSAFDVIVSINTFEHIMRVEQALRECYRVLKPGGIALLFLPPYYSPWGPHLELWVHFPWPHIFFSEKTLMKVVAREEARLRLSQEFVGMATHCWDRNISQIPDVNRITLRQFRGMVSKVGFSVKQVILLPVGYEFLRSGGFPKRALLSLLNIMASLPFLQEVVVTKIACVLQKAL